jgi:predicted small lipoprotein YifL
MTFKSSIVLAALTLTSACGISGPLEKAPPMWGADRAAYEAELAKKEAERKAAEAEKAAKAAQNPAAAPAPKN